jgi:hypothetical protein
MSNLFRVFVVLTIAAGGAGYWFLQNDCTPACDADEVTSLLATEVGDGIGNDGLQFAHIRDTAGGLLSTTRRCEADIAPIISSVSETAARWSKIAYFVTRNTPSGQLVVEPHIVDPAKSISASNK